MTLNNPILAALSLEAMLESGLVLMVVGMAVVFVGLILLMTAILLVKRLLAAMEAKPAAGAAQAEVNESVVMPQTATGGTPTIDNELIAVLTAAATAVLMKPARVRRVRFVSPHSAAPHSWVSQGRTGIMTSHRPHLRRKR